MDRLDRTEFPWRELPPSVCEGLWVGGFRSIDMLDCATDRELLECPGVGQQSVEKIRVLIGAWKAKGAEERGVALVPVRVAGLKRLVPGDEKDPPLARAAEVRKKARALYMQRLSNVADIADGTTKLKIVGVCPACGHEENWQPSVEDILTVATGPETQLRALDLLRKTQDDNARGVDREDLRDLFSLMALETQDVLARFLGKGEATKAWAQLNERWRRAIRDALR